MNLCFTLCDVAVFQMDDEAMASMLADFVACPPDDEDGASGSKAS